MHVFVITCGQMCLHACASSADCIYIDINPYYYSTHLKLILTSAVLGVSCNCWSFPGSGMEKEKQEEKKNRVQSAAKCFKTAEMVMSNSTLVAMFPSKLY